MTEQTLRAYLDRVAQVRSRFEILQADVRDMLISLDGVFECLCRELQEVRPPHADTAPQTAAQVYDGVLLPEGFGAVEELLPPQTPSYEGPMEALRPGESINPAFNPNAPGFGGRVYQAVVAGIPAKPDPKREPYFSSKLGRDVYPE